MKAVYVFTLLFFSLLAELLAGTLDLPLFLSALVLYYISLTGPLGAAFLFSILFGVLLDLAYGRALPVTAVILAASLATGRLIRLKAPTHPFETALSGMGIALAAILGGSVVRLALSSQPENFGELFWELIFFGALGLFLMPLLTLLLDAAGRKLGLASALSEPKSNFDRLRPRRVRESRERKEP